MEKKRVSKQKKGNGVLSDDYGTLITIRGWERLKKKFVKDFDYGGMAIHRQDVLEYIYKELLILRP